MDITLPRQLGIAVRRRRNALGITQCHLARISGVSERLIVSLEKGEAPGIRADKLLSILDQLGLVLSIRDSEEPDVRQDTAKPKHAGKSYKDAFDNAVADLTTHTFIELEGFDALPEANPLENNANSKEETISNSPAGGNR